MIDIYIFYLHWESYNKIYMSLPTNVFLKEHSFVLATVRVLILKSIAMVEQEFPNSNARY